MRTAVGRFQRGESGNPGGRPKLPAEIKEIARANTEKAFARIAELIDSSDERVALAASEAILNRAYGRTIPGNWGEPDIADQITEIRHVIVEPDGREYEIP